MVIISGSFTEVKLKLLAISAIVKFRKFNGWSPFQPDETWFYESEQDDRVCPVCFGFETTQEFTGDAVIYNFPAREQIDPLHYVHPRVHRFNPELFGECRCSLTWIDPIGTLRNRLEDEIRSVEHG